MVISVFLGPIHLQDYFQELYLEPFIFGAQVSLLETAEGWILFPDPTGYHLSYSWLDQSIYT